MREKKGRPVSYLPQGSCFLWEVSPTYIGMGPEGVQGATGKPFGAPPLRRNPLRCGKRKVGPFPTCRKEAVPCERFRPPAGGRGTFPARESTQRAPGAAERVHVGMAAPGPPVAKIQCTASLAGARPARFTSVPGRATVAFGAADPSPGSWAPVYPWSGGKEPLQQGNLATVRDRGSSARQSAGAPRHPIGSGPQTKQRACPIRTLSVKKQGEVPLAPQGGSGGIPRPFEGGIGGPGGHRGEVGIPPAPLAGGADLPKKGLVAISESKFFLPAEPCSKGKKSSCTPQKVSVSKSGRCHSFEASNSVNQRSRPRICKVIDFASKINDPRSRQSRLHAKKSQRGCGPSDTS